MPDSQELDPVVEAAAPEGAEEPEAEAVSAEGLAPDEDAQNRGVVEALLVASDEPVPAGKLASVLNGVGAREVRAYVDDLNAEYSSTGRSFKITEVAGGFQLMVHPEFASWVRRLMKEKAPSRLSQAALETLAIVAFRQPIPKAEVEQIRGVAVDGLLRHLLEKGLVRISGRSDAVGRPLLYGTTRIFLKHFGLKTLSDLPKLREMEDLLREGEQRAAGGSELAALFRREEAGGGEGRAESDESDAIDGTSEPVPGPGGGRVETGERPADPGGAGAG